MPKLKMKTKSAAKKRFKLTAKGRNKRKLRHGAYIAKTQEHQIKAMIPYGLP